VILGSVKNIEECAVHTVPKTVLTVWHRLGERLFVSHTKMNIQHGDEHTFWKPDQPRGQSPAATGHSEQITASTVPSPGGGD
jgi:hypothetical protein